MKILEQITIKSTMTNSYYATITLARISQKTYVVQLMTTYKKEDRRYLDTFQDYSEALDEYVRKVAQYAEHTAIMTL